MSLQSFGITYNGIRTKHIAELKQFAQEVLGYTKTHDEGNFVAFTTPQGQRLELFAENTPDKQYYPLDGAVLGFEVPDFEVAIAWLQANSYEVIENGTGKGRSGAKWVHFIGPNGSTYEFVHHPSMATTGRPE